MLRKKIPIVFLSLSILILLIFASIYFIDKQDNVQATSAFNKFREKVIQVNEIQEIANNTSYKKFVEKVANLETQKNKEEQFKLIRIGWQYLYISYTETNRNELYKLLTEFKELATNEFGYKDLNASIQCFDPSCAKQPIPNEIQKIINDINNSSMSANLKSNLIQQIKTFSYLNESDSQLRVTNYLSLADSIKLDPNLENTGINEQVYKEIRDYIQNTYPDLYKDYIANEK